MHSDLAEDKKICHPVVKLLCYHDNYFIIVPKNHDTAMSFHCKHVQECDQVESACIEGW